MTERPPIDPALFEVICAKEWFEKYGAQMMPGYFEARISAYKRIEKEKYRSRPAPAALETEHEQYERICKEVSQEEHDATIAKAERERVLKECCKQCPIRNEEMPLDDRCAESCEGCLIKSVVEHLRTASTGDDER